MYVESRKTVLVILCEGQQRRHKYKEQTWTQWKKERVRLFERIALKHVHYHM